MQKCIWSTVYSFSRRCISRMPFHNNRLSLKHTILRCRDSRGSQTVSWQYISTKPVYWRSGDVLTAVRNAYHVSKERYINRTSKGSDISRCIRMVTISKPNKFVCYLSFAGRRRLSCWASDTNRMYNSPDLINLSSFDRQHSHPKSSCVHKWNILFIRIPIV